MTSALSNQQQSMMAQATALAQSGMLPREVSNPQKAFALMTMGQELGVGAWAAINGIHVIKGKPTISPQLMLALINKSGELADLKIKGDANKCSVTMARGNRSPHTETFTMDNARAMGLAGKANWHKQPAVMLKWRAVSACARVVFPDVVIGFYTHEEIDPDMPVDVEGQIVEVNYTADDFPDDEILAGTNAIEYEQQLHDMVESGGGEDDAIIGGSGTVTETDIPKDRPYSPDALRAVLQHNIIARGKRGNWTGPASKDQRQFVASMLNEAVGTAGGGDKERYLVMDWLIAKVSVKDLTKAEAGVLLDWLLDSDPHDPAAILLSATATKEIMRVLRVAMEDAGQLDLWEDEDTSDDYSPADEFTGDRTGNNPDR
jgi:hypothetical protein